MSRVPGKYKLADLFEDSKLKKWIKTLFIQNIIEMKFEKVQDGD